MIEIYYGDGKGKTSAAVGLAVRAAGRGIRVIFVQFLKNDTSGEIESLKKLPQIELVFPELFFGFLRDMDDTQKQRLCEEYEKTIRALSLRLQKDEGKKEIATVVVLDEVTHAVAGGLLSEDILCDLLEKAPESVEFVLTGRKPSERLFSMADYVSEIKKKKHPYDLGIQARRGIEF